MTTPPPSEWEHLQSVLMRVQNKRVRDGFRVDIPDDDITTPEGSLKHACTLKDTDTAAMTQLRIDLFYTIREEGARSHPPVWAVPDFTPDVYNRLRPQIICTWAEKTDDWKARGAKRRKFVRTSFRLMDKKSEDMTDTVIRQIGNKIDLAFNRNYKFKTGRYKGTYLDKPNGFQLITAPYTEPEGLRFIKDHLAIQNVVFDGSKYSTSNQPGENYRTPRTIRVGNETRTLPERRQIATVYLDKVQLNIYGNQKNILLIDRLISHRVFGRTAQYL